MRKAWMAMLMGATFAAGGCAASTKEVRRAHPSEANDAQVATAASQPKVKDLGGAAVKIVARKPSPQKYKFVGRIEARSASGDIVDAAIAADADLRRQAKALGADVIKLDVIAPPSDHPSKHSRVILAGRAYKKSS